ncbi:hypothetical protein [Mycolicibacterium sp. CBMA 226]|uniref:hypothetical protein n=1 Tax=Mycolicibacterium sp. CBMA 226 TaxID=2606611 RepID=UPI0014124869|nr:hypothetical protein [Mycolicibacterium sp. CBMA 226]
MTKFDTSRLVNSVVGVGFPVPGTAIEYSAAQPIGIKNADVRTSSIDPNTATTATAKEPINRRISAPPDGDRVANTLRRRISYPWQKYRDITEIHSNRRKSADHSPGLIEFTT